MSETPSSVGALFAQLSPPSEVQQPPPKRTRNTDPLAVNSRDGKYAKASQRIKSYLKNSPYTRYGVVEELRIKNVRATNLINNVKIYWPAWNRNDPSKPAHRLIQIPEDILIEPEQIEDSNKAIEEDESVQLDSLESTLN